MHSRVLKQFSIFIPSLWIRVHHKCAFLSFTLGCQDNLKENFSSLCLTYRVLFANWSICVGMFKLSLYCFLERFEKMHKMKSRDLLKTQIPSDLSAERGLVIRWSIMCLSKHSGLHSRLPALEAQLLPTKCHLGTCNTGHWEGVWNRPCHSQPTASLIAPIWHAQPGPMSQSSGIHCAPLKGSDGFMFAKPVFSALNTVTCSSAISKGFFQSHLCGNLSFCDAYESLVKCPRGERVKQTCSHNDCDSYKGFQL